MPAVLAQIILQLLFTQACLALYVAKGTPCSTQCNSTGGSFWTDLVCSTDDFANTVKGQTLESCLSCTIDSTYINSTYTDGNSDQFWTLFHMKYVQQYCLIDNTTPRIAAVNACVSVCSPLSDVLDTLWINKHPFVGQYDYCTQDSSAYTTYADDCAKCLQGQKESTILGNFVDTMNEACSSRPLAANGEKIKPERDLFDTSVLSPNTTPSSTVSTTTASVSSAATHTSFETTSAGALPTVTSTNPTSVSSRNSSLSAGAAAGIGAAVAVIAIASLAGLFFLVKRKRKMRSHRLAINATETSPEAKYARSSDKIHGSPLYEKPAAGSEAQIYEAPNESQTHFVELPANLKT